MRFEIKKLKKIFNEDFDRVLEEASNALDLIGMQLISHDGFLSIQYDFNKIDFDPVSRLVFMTLTGKGLETDKGKEILTKLSRPELAVLGVILSIVESEKRSKIPIIEIEDSFNDIMTLQVLKGNLTKLRNKQYIKLTETTIEVNWRLRVELGIKTSKIKEIFQKKQ